jgi:nitrogen fixation NifU-like protein
VSASRIYHEAIKALADAAVGQGTLDRPDAVAFIDNPLCGDCVEMQVSLREGHIDALAHKVRGCLLCRAAASAIGKHALGADRAGIERIGAAVTAMLEQQAAPPAGWDELLVFAPVHGHPSRYGCVQLPFRALLQALDSVSV